MIRFLVKPQDALVFWFPFLFFLTLFSPARVICVRRRPQFFLNFSVVRTVIRFSPTLPSDLALKKQENRTVLDPGRCSGSLPGLYPSLVPCYQIHCRVVGRSLRAPHLISPSPLPARYPVFFYWRLSTPGPENAVVLENTGFLGPFFLFF